MQESARALYTVNTFLESKTCNFYVLAPEENTFHSLGVALRPKRISVNWHGKENIAERGNMLSSHGLRLEVTIVVICMRNKSAIVSESVWHLRPSYQAGRQHARCHQRNWIGPRVESVFGPTSVLSSQLGSQDRSEQIDRLFECCSLL